MVDILNWFAADSDRFGGLLLVIGVTGWAFSVARGKSE